MAIVRGFFRSLLSGVERKNGWQLAGQVGDARPWRTQRVLSHVLWDEGAARDLCRNYVIERLGGREGVLIVDETGFLKKRAVVRCCAAIHRHGWAD